MTGGFQVAVGQSSSNNRKDGCSPVFSLIRSPLTTSLTMLLLTSIYDTVSLFTSTRPWMELSKPCSKSLWTLLALVLGTISHFHAYWIENGCFYRFIHVLIWSDDVVASKTIFSGLLLKFGLLAFQSHFYPNLIWEMHYNLDQQSGIVHQVLDTGQVEPRTGLQ